MRDIKAERLSLLITSTIFSQVLILSATRNNNRSTVGVIDIFAGPGGLGEGFSSFESAPQAGSFPFELVVSAEMEVSAHATLRLRAFYRLLRRQQGEIHADYWNFLNAQGADKAPSPAEFFEGGQWRHLWKQAGEEALNLTLGEPSHNRVLFDRIKKTRDQYDEMVLIGGPPCQAYSLVGRARNRNVEGFHSRGDPRHFLYKQYLSILAEFKPAIFIMENVKGILTSKVGNKEMFSAIREDLADPAKALGRASTGCVSDRYELLPIHVPHGAQGGRTTDLVADPSGFVIRCERHGAPQARHRVIIMGVRGDFAKPGVARVPGLDMPSASSKLESALAGLPGLRSGLSREADDPIRWFKAMNEERRQLIGAIRSRLPDVADVLESATPEVLLPRSSTRYAPGRTSSLAGELRGRSEIVLNHATRGHMKSDLGRYMFCAAYAEARRRSPTSKDFPARLAPDHKNWGTGAFVDRFRAQMRGEPSSTITSHLSKDGHAFIHWDPGQCRSLTVREAARLQTFPDDYLFLGNRTQQYVQVGNAVPPLIARQIARVVWSILRG